MRVTLIQQVLACIQLRQNEFIIGFMENVVVSTATEALPLLVTTDEPRPVNFTVEATNPQLLTATYGSILLHCSCQKMLQSRVTHRGTKEFESRLKRARPLVSMAQTMRHLQAIRLLLYPASITQLPWLMDAHRDTGIISSLVTSKHRNGIVRDNHCPCEVLSFCLQL